MMSPDTDQSVPTFAELAKADAAEKGRALPALCRPMSIYASADMTAALSDLVPDMLDLNSLAPAEAIKSIKSGIVLVEHSFGEASAVIAAVASTRTDLAMLVVGDDLPVQDVRAMLRFQASDILPADCDLRDILDASSQLCDLAKPKEDAPGAKVWAFRGAVGGAGVTTLAIEVASALSRRPSVGSVCLIDLNLCDAMSPAFLDGQPKLDLKAVCDAPERLDETLLRAYGWTHKNGVTLIAAKRDPKAETLATADAILQLLETASTMFEHVVLDLPRHAQAWTETVLSVVDEVVVVSELTVPSLHAAADLCRETDRLRGNLEPARLVLNRMYTKKRFQTAFPIEKAERAIQRDINLTIASDWDAARTAVNLGMPVAEVKAKSQMVTDVIALVEHLCPEIANDNALSSGMRGAM